MEMEIENNTRQELTAVLNQAAKKLSLNNFSMNLNVSAQKGDGFLSELHKASITDNTTNTTLHLVIKKAPSDKQRRDETCIENAYKNEINFYSDIMPTFKKFQQECQISPVFNCVPGYVVSVKEVGKEMIVLHDITFNGYRMRQKDLILDEEHIKLIFQTYGRLHALSFCLKEQKPEEYNNLARLCNNVYQELMKKRGFPRALNHIAEQALAILDKDDDRAVINKFKIYAEEASNIFSQCIIYQGNYSTILHGDCWSNNMMFKYRDPENKTGVEDVTLLDFQLAWTGTPVYDLSYFFYSGGSKSVFKYLDHYLDLYHESFSNFSQKLGCKPHILLPREVLTQEWRMYGKFGMLMSLLLIKVKLLTKEQSVELADSIGKSENGKFTNANVNNEIFNKRAKDLLQHLHEMDAL